MRAEACRRLRSTLGWRASFFLLATHVRTMVNETQNVPIAPNYVPPRRNAGADMVRLCRPKVTVVDSSNITRTVHVFHVPLPTLAQVVSAVMWELSWGGNPQQT